MNKLDEAVEKILSEVKPDTWTALCIATVELGAAFAKFDKARKAYIESQKEEETIYHDVSYNRSRKLWVVKSTLGPATLQLTREKKPTAEDLEGDYMYLDSKLLRARDGRKR